MPGITLCLPAYPLLLRPSFRVLPVTVFLTSGEHAMSALLCFSFVFGHDASVIHGALFTLVNRDPVHWVTTLCRFWNFENFLDRIWIEGTFLKDRKVNVERFKIYSNIGMRFLSSFLFFFCSNFVSRKHSYFWGWRKTKHANSTDSSRFFLRDAFQKRVCFLSNGSTCFSAFLPDIIIIRARKFREDAFAFPQNKKKKNIEEIFFMRHISTDNYANVTRPRDKRTS